MKILFKSLSKRKSLQFLLGTICPLVYTVRSHISQMKAYVILSLYISSRLGNENTYLIGVIFALNFDFCYFVLWVSD